ncbi:fimbrial biogenesis outer membrane usher protein [Enterobacter sp. Ap-1006]|uniref:CS1-pili formation C-terminal domain-containing protein n=1 Tax=Enterobacter sp. Ap-1006 TaxID=2608345 RepID=UPI00142234E3|nr:CS1-pili formation C-terminal domain-containing protein [Enterobacter sp. Ap-1006]NIF48660.1 fimbrial biogenesis outer membrane usher protein [Enterobacter sp. Ap-1006]
MFRQYFFITKILTLIFCTIFSSTIVAQSLQDVRLGNYIIPGIFGQALIEGMSIPVFLSYKGGKEEDKQKVADALVVLDKDRLMIKEITLAENSGGATLSAETEALINELKDRFFDQNSDIVLSSEADLKLNIRSFILTLSVSQRSLSAAVIPRQDVLAASSVQNSSSVLNYDLGLYRTQVRQGRNDTNSYLNVDNTFAIAEHHFNVNGALYGIGDSQQNAQLYRAMYEKDRDGHRLAFGLVDTWNLQSIGSLSAINSSKLYGLTYGNKTATRTNNTSYSLTPITVFLPSAGEVHIYRQGRLLNIQNFPMGSFEVDTSPLPYGIYDVDIETVIDGKVNGKMRQTINKPFRNDSSEANAPGWQVYGGYMDYKNRRNSAVDEDKQTYLAGISAAVSFPDLARFSDAPSLLGLTVQTSSYAFDQNLVNETSINASISPYGTLGWQGLISQGGRHRNIFSASLMLPEGYGSLWANREKSHIGEGLPVYESDSYSWGGSFSLDRMFDRGGQITLSRTVDKRDRSTSNNFEYSTSLVSGRHGSIGLRAGVQRYQYDYQSNSMNQRYISLDFSLPLATWLSAGVSSNNGNMQANLAATKSFDDSAITSAGFSISKQVKEKNKGDSHYSASGYSTFDTKYSAGTVSLSRPDDKRLNGNLTARGSVAYSDNKIAASGLQEKSGLMIKTDIEDDAMLSAQVNGRSYKLSGKNNFIPLPSYASYKVELLNDKNSADSFDIVKGRTSSVTLYPGNVAVHTPEIKQLVTVFGRMTTENGKAIANAQIRNHIGKTTTDENGDFSMDVDKRYPVVSLTTADNSVCEVDLDLRKARGVMWVGDRVCETQTILAQR